MARIIRTALQREPKLVAPATIGAEVIQANEATDENILAIQQLSEIVARTMGVTGRLPNASQRKLKLVAPAAIGTEVIQAKDGMDENIQAIHHLSEIVARITGVIS